MDSGFSLDDVVIIKISNINIWSVEIEMHAKIFTGISEAHVIHKTAPFFFSYFYACTIGLFNDDYKLFVLIPSESQNFQTRIIEDGIVDNNPVQCQPEYIVVLKGDKFTYHSMSDVKINDTLCAIVFYLTQRG